MASTFEENKLNALTNAFQKTILTSSAQINTSGDNQVVAGIVGQRICVTSIIVQLEASASVSALIKANGTILKRILLVVQGDALILNYANGFELKLPVGNNLLINTSNTNLINYSIEYYLE